MTVPGLSWFPRGSTAEALLHFLGLFLVLALSIVSLGFLIGGLLCFFLYQEYLLWNVHSAKRPVKKPFRWWSGLRQELKDCRFSLFILLHLCLSVVLTAVLTGFLISVFFVFPDVFPVLVVPIAELYPELGYKGFFVGLAVLISAPVLAFACLLVFENLGADQEARTGLWRRVRKRWFAALFRQLLIAMPAGLALSGIVFVSLIGGAIGYISTNSYWSSGQHAYTVLTGNPALLLVLLGTAVALVSHRSLAFQYARSPTRGGHEGANHGATRRRGKLIPIVALLLIGAVAITFGQMKIVRAGTVALYAGIPMLTYVSSTLVALNEWVAESTEHGLDAELMVARLNEKGHWSSDNPEQGLAELFPELREDFAKMEGELSCTMRVAAVPLSAQEKLDAPEFGSPIKYCFRSVCRSAQLGVDDSATWLLSIDPGTLDGRSRFLISTARSTIVLDTSGGLCTASGDLADGGRG